MALRCLGVTESDTLAHPCGSRLPLATTQTSPAIRALKFAKREEEHPYAGTVEGMPDTIEYYEITNPTAVGEDVAVPDFVIPNAQGDKFLHLAEQVRALAGGGCPWHATSPMRPHACLQRLADASQREKIDKLVAREFMHFRVALMFGAHGEEALTKTRGLDYSLEIQRRKQALLRPIVEANSGDLAEPQLIFFESCHDAFLAAIQLRAALNTYNQEHVRTVVLGLCVLVALPHFLGRAGVDSRKTKSPWIASECIAARCCWYQEQTSTGEYVPQRTPAASMCQLSQFTVSHSILCARTR